MFKEYKKLPYPMNLWSAVLGRLVSCDELPEDWELALDCVLNALKTEKEKEILLHYYKDGLSLSATGDLYGVTSERIRQQMNAAMRRLRHPVRKAFFLYGWEKGLAAAEQVAAEQEELTKDQLQKLGLSIRPWNCLIMAGVDTISKLVQCTEEDLYQMRNMGKKSVQEIKEKLAERGLALKPKAGAAHKKVSCDQCGSKTPMEDTFVYGGKTYCMDCLYPLLMAMAESGNVNLDFVNAEEKGIQVCF